MLKFFVPLALSPNVTLRRATKAQCFVNALTLENYRKGNSCENEADAMKIEFGHWYVIVFVTASPKHHLKNNLIFITA